MLKQMIKKVVGQQNITKGKQYIKYLKDFVYLQNHPRISVEQEDLLYQKFSQKGKHVFFGYYDLSQFDPEEKKLLVHVVDKKADTINDKAELGYYDLNNCAYKSFSKTSAWCWQQGSRLRWVPSYKDSVMFNDVKDGHYISRVYNVKSGEETLTLCDALYDVDPTMSYGLSLNFSRLQRLRPGYGYGILKDNTEGDPAPEDDGIFYIDISNNSKKLIVRLSDLAAQVDDSDSDEHYINHISISPDGKKFMFFHIWTLKNDNHWKTRLCVYNLQAKSLQIIEDQDRVSHYDWINNEELLVTCWDKQKKQYYCIYNVKNGEKTILEDKNLIHDGHPSVCHNGKNFISDTYPLSHDMQTLFEYNLDLKSYTPHIQLYSDALLYDEKRCDLHPRISKSEKYITFDSTCENGCRQVILLKNWGLEHA